MIKNTETSSYFVLDTKWKNITDKNLSVEDLRQLYVYHDFYKAKKVALFYPVPISNKGFYFDTTINSSISEKECSLLGISSIKDINSLKKDIIEKIKSFLN